VQELPLSQCLEEQLEARAPLAAPQACPESNSAVPSAAAAFLMLRADLASACGDGPSWLKTFEHARVHLQTRLEESYPPRGWYSVQCHETTCGFQGSMTATYSVKEHSVEIRSDLVMPGSVADHFEGLMEPDLAPIIASGHFAAASMQRSADIPGNMLCHLVFRLPTLPSRWNRDIVLHRQVFRFNDGFAAVEYSPKCFPCDQSACKICEAYFKGGRWRDGLPGVDIPKCKSFGRDAQFGGYYIEPHEKGVRWRNVQTVEITAPRWLPVPSSWYTASAVLIAKETLKAFARARLDPATKQLYAQRVQENQINYQSAWYPGVPKVA